MLSPAEIAKAYSAVGVRKAALPTGKILLLSIFAGFFIGIAGASAMIASCTIDNGSLSRLINALVFPGGLVMVILAGSELFTGDCLMSLSLFSGKISITAFLRILLLVYVGNFLGGLVVSFFFVYSHTPDLFGGAIARSLVSTAAAKTSLSFSDALLRGILCNILVCVAVWITIGAPTMGEKILGLYLPIVVFVLGGYEHCVANMFYIPAGLMASAEYHIPAEGLSWISFFVSNLIPVTLGNILGGSVFVGLGYYLIYGREDKG